MRISIVLLVLAVCAGLAPVIGQTKITNFTATINFPTPSGAEEAQRTLRGTGTLDPAGDAAAQLELSQAASETKGGVGAGAGPGRAIVTVATSRLDILTRKFDFPDPGFPFRYAGPARVTGGTGAYQDAQGSADVVMTRPPDDETYTLTATVNMTAGAQSRTLVLNMPALTPNVAKFQNRLSLSAKASAPPLGDFTVSLVRARDSTDGQQVVTTWVLNYKDSFTTHSGFVGAGFPATVNGNSTGGTGAFASAGGFVTFNLVNGYVFNVSGRIVQPAIVKGAPVIESVTTVGRPERIATNTWIEIKGRNLVPVGTPAWGVTWMGTPEFGAGLMPTELSGVSVLIGGRPG